MGLFIKEGAMKRGVNMKILGEVQSVVGFALGAAVAFAHGAGEPPLELFATIPMPGVKGRIDHFAIDVKRHRLFVAALENDTLEVLDVERNRHEKSISGFGEPQGLIYLPELNRVYVANGSGDRVDVLDAASLAPLKRIGMPRREPPRAIFPYRVILNPSSSSRTEAAYS